MSVITGFWLRQYASIGGAKPPLLGWMISAEVAIIAITVLTIENYRYAKSRERLELRMQLVQYGFIITGNTIVVVAELYHGVPLRPWDYIIFQIDLVGLYALGVIVCLGKLYPTSAWAKCWYAIVLKVVPQLVQALWIYNKKGTLDLLGVAFLIVQAFGRCLTPVGTYFSRGRRVPQRLKALAFSTGADLLSTLAIAAAVIWVS